jgi:hypothetical protein
MSSTSKPSLFQDYLSQKSDNKIPSKVTRDYHFKTSDSHGPFLISNASSKRSLFNLSKSQSSSQSAVAADMLEKKEIQVSGISVIRPVSGMMSVKMKRDVIKARPKTADNTTNIQIIKKKGGKINSKCLKCVRPIENPKKIPLKRVPIKMVIDPPSWMKTIKVWTLDWCF